MANNGKSVDEKRDDNITRKALADEQRRKDLFNKKVATKKMQEAQNKQAEQRYSETGSKRGNSLFDQVNINTNNLKPLDDSGKSLHDMLDDKAKDDSKSLLDMVKEREPKEEPKPTETEDSGKDDDTQAVKEPSKRQIRKAKKEAKKAKRGAISKFFHSKAGKMLLTGGFGSAIIISFVVAFVVGAGATVLIALSVKEIREDLPEEFLAGIDFSNWDTIGLKDGLDSNGGLIINGKKQDSGSTNTTTASANGLYVKICQNMAEEEMGNSTSGLVAPALNDGAGKNYGKYSFTQVYEIAPSGGGGFVPWLKEKYPDLGGALTGSPASSEFDAQWQKLGQDKDSEFTEAQAHYVVEKVLQNSVGAIKNATGVDLNSGKYSLGVWNLLVSMYNQRPAWTNEKWIPYLSSNKDASSADIINAMAGGIESTYSGNYQDSIRARYGRQKATALGQTELVKVD